MLIVKYEGSDIFKIFRKTFEKDVKLFHILSMWDPMQQGHFITNLKGLHLRKNLVEIGLLVSEKKPFERKS